MRGKILVLLVLASLLLVPCVLSDKSGNIQLLAMLQKGEKRSGTIANLNLEIEPGSGRVYLETFPLTKISTQVSMRFAQQIACSELDIACEKYDFFYKISALPGIVGGPSAGAAAAVLAGAMLLDLEIKDDSAITGTINSGGVIGAVGGLKGKIEAASKNGIKLVVIPKGTRMYKEKKESKDEAEEDDEEAVHIEESGENQEKDDEQEKSEEDEDKTDLFEHGKKLNVTVVEAATLQEALEYMAGYEADKTTEPFVIDKVYKKTMKAVSIDLCDRNQEIHEDLIKTRLGQDTAKPSEDEESALNYSKKGEEAFEGGEFYSSASFCFRSNVILKKELYSFTNYTEDEINRSVSVLDAKIDDFSKEMDSKNITTITDLQTYMAVKERINDAQKILEGVEDKDSAAEKSKLIAYAEERLYSAKAWSKFFNGKDVAFELDEKRLRDSCQSKIDEAEERHGYLREVLPALVLGVRQEIDEAYDLLDEKKYIMCLHKAVKAKSEVGVVLGLLGVQEEMLEELIDLKIEIVQHALVRTQKKGIFPIIGYSYYEYSNSLKDSDKYSSLLFAEYALELSNIDIYFPKKSRTPLQRIISGINTRLALAFSVGLIIGILLMWPVRRKYKTLQTSPKRRLRGKKR